MSRPLADRELSGRPNDKGEVSAPGAEQILVHAQAFVEEWILRALPPRDVPPTRLHGAMHDAVFPGGRRARPLLCRLIADRYGGGDDEMVGRMAAAVELVHCASLVQDDLPCFDDAATRRGLPSCHVVHGEAAAILVGDALLTLAFETLSNAPVRRAGAAFRLMGLLTSATGSTNGVIGGQGLELEPHAVDVGHYHRQKTAALFRAAAAGGAICCGAEADVVALGAAGRAGRLRAPASRRYRRRGRRRRRAGQADRPRRHAGPPQRARCSRGRRTRAPCARRCSTASTSCSAP